jgi:hypothetical protein
MKGLKYLLLSAFMVIPLIGSYTKETGLKSSFRAYRPVVHKKKEISVVLETLTVYNPVKRQCDSSPLVTASNAKIDTKKLYRQEIRWMALSRDLLKRWNGHFQYGDTVRMASGDPEIDGLWIIQDTLNKRYKSAGDLLFDGRVRKLGKWKNVTITKIESPAIELPEIR